jgi:hypothetical protein
VTTGIGGLAGPNVDVPSRFSSWRTGLVASLESGVFVSASSDPSRLDKRSFRPSPTVMSQDIGDSSATRHR